VSALCLQRHRRHSAAVHLVAAGVDITVIHSWMGHAHLDTTNLYAQANLETKRKALNQLDPERFLYEYDFYDNWKHDIRLEKVLPLNSKRVFPVCTGGQRPVPPEDCGGARAYSEEGGPALAGMVGCYAAGRPETDSRDRQTLPRFERRPLRHRGSRESDGRRRAGQSS